MTSGGADLEARARRVKLLALDVDGVLTDGTIWTAPDGTVTKRFHIRDGHALVMMRKYGVELAILSGREDAATSARAKELGFVHVVQGLRKKLPAARDLSGKLGLDLDEVAYMGDDINDVPVIEAVGLGAAPADAAPEARDAARFVSAHPGGGGAVRELCETILKAKGAWSAVLEAMR